MKARYTKLPDKRTKDIYEREVKEMQERFAVLYEKVQIYVMNEVFGWGTERLKRLFDTIGDTVDTMKNDPIFWDKVDRVVIDKLGFDYPRCDCEYMEKVFYSPPEVTAEEKRHAVADMKKMKEFLEANYE